MAIILVIDDEANERTLIRSVLEDAGHSVEEAGDGQTALGILGVDPADRGVRLPDLILLDIMLPGIDGYTLANMLGGGPAASVPIVVLTAKGQMREMFRDSRNIKAYLEKPFQPDRLADEVERALSPVRRES